MYLLRKLFGEVFPFRMDHQRQVNPIKGGLAHEMISTRQSMSLCFRHPLEVGDQVDRCGRRIHDEDPGEQGLLVPCPMSIPSPTVRLIAR